MRPGGLWVDGTVGLGGHAEAILRASAPDGRLLGFDRDGETLERARARLAPFGDRVRLEHADYREIPRPARGRGGRRHPARPRRLARVQLDDPERGFSFQAEGPLDMRMDRSRARRPRPTLVNRLRERDLADLIYEYGEEPASRRIARAIVRARERAPIRDHDASSPTIVRRAARRSRRPGLAPRDAHLPGAAHPREPRARRPRAEALERARRVPAARRPPGRDRVPLARGPRRSSRRSARSTARGFRDARRGSRVRPGDDGDARQPARPQRAPARARSRGGAA